MFTKGQTSELGGVTSSNIPSPLYLFLKVLPPVYNERGEESSKSGLLVPDSSSLGQKRIPYITAI